MTLEARLRVPGTVCRALQVLELQCCLDPTAGHVSPGGLDHSSPWSEEYGFHAWPLGWKGPDGRITLTPQDHHREGLLGQERWWWWVAEEQGLQAEAACQLPVTGKG